LFARHESHAKAAASTGRDKLTKPSDFANERQQKFGRFRPFDDGAVQETFQ